MRNQSLYDQLTKGIGDAIADVRTKVIEEPWYGRPVSERDSLTIEWPEAKEAQSIDCAEQEQGHEYEQDIDR